MKKSILMMGIIPFILAIFLFIFIPNNAPLQNNNEVQITPDVWKKYVDETLKVSYQYPEQLSTQYITVLDWPPQLGVIKESNFRCTEAGVETERAGKTEERMVDGRSYCVTSVVEGAAGSIYTQYAYSTILDTIHYVLTFTIQSVACENYEEPNKTACENEREAFDLDGVVDRVMHSITKI